MVTRANRPNRTKDRKPNFELADPDMQTRPGKYLDPTTRSGRAPLSKAQQYEATPRLETRSITPLSRQGQNFESEQGWFAPTSRFGGLYQPEFAPWKSGETGLMTVSSKSRGKGKNKGSGLSLAQRRQALDAITAEMEKAGIHITSGYRTPNDPLTIQNPGSLHARSRAFDSRARTPAAADINMAKQREVFDRLGLVEGRDYRFIDEARHPSKHARGKHVHTEFTNAGIARYHAAVTVAANVPTQTARPAQPGDIDPFSDTTYSPETEAAPSGGLRPGFTGSSLAPSFAAPGPGTIGGLLGRPSAGLGFMPGSGALAPAAVPSTDRFGPTQDNLPGLTAVTPTARPSPPSAERLGRSTTSELPDLTTAMPTERPASTTRMGLMNVPVNEARSFTPDLNKVGIVTPGMLGKPTAVAEASSLHTAPTPTLADRAVRESITSALPDQGPTLADRPAARTVAAAQPAATALDAIKTNFDEDATPARDVADHPLMASVPVAKAAPGAVSPDTSGAYPPAPDEYNPGVFNPDAYETGIGQVAKNAFKGLMRSGPVGGLLGGLGTWAMQNMPSGFNEAVPESSRFSVGSGLSGINAALSGPKGATATSRSNPGMSVTSLGNGQSLRRSDRYGWTEVVGPDGSVVGIQYDNPTGKGILGKSILGSHQGLFGWASNKAGSTFGGSNGLSPSASRAIRDGTAGGLY